MSKEEINDILLDLKNRPNRDLVGAMVSLNVEFEKIKNLMLKLSSAMDEIEKIYGAIHSEYLRRGNN